VLIWKTTTILPSSASLLLDPSSSATTLTSHQEDSILLALSVNHSRSLDTVVANNEKQQDSNAVQPQQQQQQQQGLHDERIMPSTSTTTTTTSMTRHVCPNTRHLFESEESIQSAYKDLEEFHNAGGNLKAIEKYLNDNIDETLKILNVTFTPKGSNQPLSAGQSISQTIDKLLMQNDKRKRRGYDQRHMPGLYQPLDHKALRGRRNRRMSFDVIEPVTYFSRWRHGLGPIPTLCKNLDVIQPTGGKKEQSFEEKFMCSFPSKVVNNENNTMNYMNDNQVVGGGDTQQQQQQQQQQQPDKGSSPSSCQMISIGSNGEWGFENSIISSTECIVHTFDCTVLHPSKPNTDSIQFYPYCISAEHNKIGNQEFVTYSQMVERASLSQPPSLLKIDVEGFEFDVFTQMLREAQEKNSKHLLPQQISVELHYSTRMYDLPWHMRLRQAGEIALFAGMMYRQGGYVIVHVKYIRGCDACAEVLFVRVFCD
jgi:FkbM family methyltransferase